MFKDDAEGRKLVHVNGYDELLTQIEQKFNSIVNSMFEFGLKVSVSIINVLNNFKFIFSRKKNYAIAK